MAYQISVTLFDLNYDPVFRIYVLCVSDVYGYWSEIWNIANWIDVDNDGNLIHVFVTRIRKAMSVLNRNTIYA